MALTLSAPNRSDPIDGTLQGSPAFRTPPRNIEAEKALLGAILVNNRAYERVSDFLRAEHFAVGPHGRIFEACARLIERGQIADPVTLKNLFEQDEALSDIGGPAYLADLATSAAPVSNAGEYGHIIFDLFLKRQLIGLGEDVVNDAYAAEVEESAPHQIERAEERLYKLADSGEYEGGFQPFKDSVISAIQMADAAHKREGGLAGVPTGLIDLDKLLGGLHPSDLIVLAARPSMGKTSLATNIAFNAAYSMQESGGREGAIVGFFSLEMSAEQLAARVISEQTNISSDRMRKGELRNDEFDRLVPASQTLHRIPIFIDDTPALSVSQLRTRARRLKRQHGLGLIVVDYLQLMSASAGTRVENRVQEISEITRGLKAVAKDLNVPVLALSQLSRAVESREPPRPLLSDLRESGTIEQDADVVMFIYREQYYIERQKPSPRADEDDGRFATRFERWEERRRDAENKAEVIIAKQRHGPIGNVLLHFSGTFTRFSNYDRDRLPER